MLWWNFCQENHRSIVLKILQAWCFIEATEATVFSGHCLCGSWNVPIIQVSHRVVLNRGENALVPLQGQVIRPDTALFWKSCVFLTIREGICGGNWIKCFAVLGFPINSIKCGQKGVVFYVLHKFVLSHDFFRVILDPNCASLAKAGWVETSSLECPLTLVLSAPFCFLWI